MRLHHGDRLVVGDVGYLACEHVEEDDPQRVDVALVGDGRRLVVQHRLGLLRTHVAGGSPRKMAFVIGRGRKHGNPKIGEKRLMLGVEEDIGGLNVAVDDALLVRLVYRPRQIGEDGGDGLQGECPVGEPLHQCAAGQVLHDQIRLVFVFAKIENADDVGVEQAGNEPGFVVE